MSRRGSPGTWLVPTVAVVTWLATAGNVFAQGTNLGTLTGAVADTSGGVLPGVTVTAVEASTNIRRVTISSEAGLFRLPALSPGAYLVKVELSGFTPLNVGEINLLSSEVRNLGRLVLQLGGVAESIMVTAEATPVQTAASSRTATVTSDQLKNIQMRGRDVYGLLAVLPGVQDTNLNRDFTTWTSMRNVTINGNPVTAKNVLIDGISVVDEGGSGNANVNPNIDAIGEIQVIANGFTAENGRNNGGLINLVTKSGTNQIRGSAWYNGRRDRFNSLDYFRKVNNQEKPLYRVNIPGYSVGGPVVIPRVLDSRTGQHKMFFFISQEYSDDARPSGTLRVNLPTDLERTGDFSQTRVTNGSIQPIIDPLTGQPFPGNIIPASRLTSTGRAMMNLLPSPNGILNSQAGQAWTSNSAYDVTPLHNRTNTVLRLDGAIKQNLRASYRYLKDREDNWSTNNFVPGEGWVNNAVPGWVHSGSLTWVVKPTIINEMNGGYTHNSWGFVAGTGPRKSGFDYTQWYRANNDPALNTPLLKGSFGPFSDPPSLAGNRRQVDEWPYIPRFTTSGGNRSNLAGYRTSGNQPLPRGNYNGRWSFQNDLSILQGRHSYKFGFYTELDSKTEPGTPNYAGNFNFGHNASNPLNTGNGYANLLLGIFNTYQEDSNRVNKDVRHWQTEGYLQDTWRMSSRFTLDYGLRLTHSGNFYEVWDVHTAFFPDLWTEQNAARVYRTVCRTGVAGNRPCSGSNQRAIDPANPSVLLPTVFNGRIVPGTGLVENGISTQGLAGKKPGVFFTFPGLVAAPRVGFAWDLAGNGKSALRSSFGMFYNFPRGDYNAYIGGPPVSFNRQIEWATVPDIGDLAARGIQFVESPASRSVAGGERPLGKAYNVNVAFQRDIGFNTVVEAAYVGNFSWIGGRTEDINRLPLYVYANPSNLLNNEPLNVNYLRTQFGAFPGMGAINQYVPDLFAQSLKYNSLQLNAVRRLTRGLQMGVAYTISKGEGYQGYDPYTFELGGAAAIRQRYWGPTDVDRRHNLVVNYSYNIPTPTDRPVLKQLLGGWEVSGVTKFLSGAAVTVSCQSNNSGIQNTNPSLTDGFFTNAGNRRCLLTGAPIFSGFEVDPNVAFADQPHFNMAAFALPQPTDTNGDGVFDVGNFGNAPLGLLRHPSWQNWDITLARRIPVGQRANVRLQFQAYNVFNTVQFDTLDAAFTFTGPGNTTINSASTGKYTSTIPARILGLTVRIDY